jgi:hypothetical protein
MTLAALAGRELFAGASREQAVRQAGIRRLALALALGRARQQLKDNRAQLLAIAGDIAPGLTSLAYREPIQKFTHCGSW